MALQHTHTRTRGALVLMLAAMLVGASACGSSQDTTPTNALAEQGSRDDAARVVSGPLSDTLDEEAEENAQNTSTETHDQDDHGTADHGTADSRDRLDAAMLAALAGETERAKRDLKALTSNQEVGAYALYNLGVIAFSEGKTQQAEDYIRQSLDKDPAFGPGTVATVRRMLHAGQTSEAQAFVNQQLQKSENAPGVRAANLFVKLHQQDYQGVIDDTRSILIDEPTNIDAHYALSMAYLALGRVELAGYILREARKRDDNRADLYVGLGKIAITDGNEEEARRHWNEALDRNPHYPEATVAISALDLKKMEYERVVEALEPLVKDLPDYVDAWLNYGSGLKGVGKSNEAKAAFEKALALDPQSAAASFNLGILYLDVNDFEGLDQKTRMETALTWFEKYRALSKSIGAEDPVTSYEQFARQEIQMQEELERQAREEEERKRRREEQQKEGSKDDDSSDDGWDDDGWGDDDGWDDDW